MPRFTHPLRPKILQVLMEPGKMTRSKLAEELASDSDVSSDDRQHVEIALHHSHLPKLDERNYIDYDHRSGDIVLRGESHDIESCLEAWGL